MTKKIKDGDFKLFDEKEYAKVQKENRLFIRELAKNHPDEAAFLISETWDENEESMGEMAAFSITCDQLGIEEDEAYEILANGNTND